jgi:hypothetical protein
MSVSTKFMLSAIRSLYGDTPISPCDMGHSDKLLRIGQSWASKDEIERLAKESRIMAVNSIISLLELAHGN